VLPSIDVIIVNWNAGQQLARCLESIPFSNDDLDLHRVVVVDNASTDGSREALDRRRLPLHIVRNQHNRGFAAACNQGAKGSKADYLLFLNPDTRLFSDSLSKPLRFMKLPHNRQIAIVGVQLVDADSHVSRTCARFPTVGWFFAKMLGLDRVFPSAFPSQIMTEWDHRASREVDQVMGAFFLVRRAAFETLGGFDERFFVYFEDVDFALRAREQGWRTFYLCDAQAYHKGGGTTEQIKPTRLFYALRSRILYAYKHFRWWPATGVLLGTMVVEPLSRVALAILRGSGTELRATLKGYAMVLGDMPRILQTAWRPRA